MSRTVANLQRMLAPVLAPFGWAYGGCMWLRGQLYARGARPAWEPDALTVSVGNIGWGGTGKTPIAGWLLDWAETHYRSALLLTRGYKAKPVTYPYLVKPGALAEEAGDEPLMLATQHPKAHIVVDPVRTRGGRWAMKKFRPGLVVLDDGFQHMAVKRHLNLVLLRPEDLTSGWNKVIPAGSWREPASALARADAFLIKAGTRNFQKIKPVFERRLGHLRKPLFSFGVQPTGLRKVLTGERTFDFEKGGYLLVTGVGDPRLVEQSATAYFGYRPEMHMAYPDHHAYTKNDVRDMEANAARLGCVGIVCTPKDAVKLGPMCTDNFWQFELAVGFGPSTIGRKMPFDAWWNHRFEKLEARCRAARKSGSPERAMEPHHGEKET